MAIVSRGGGAEQQNETAGIGDQIDFDPFDDANVDQWHDAPGGECEVDGAASNHFGSSKIWSALVHRDVMALLRQVDREQSTCWSRADDNERAVHSTIPSRISTKRSMSANEL